MLIDFRQLFPKYNINPTGVLHVGANVGEEAPVYHELNIKDVIWIEPNPKLIARLCDNVQTYNHTVYNIAAGHETKKINLHISNNGGQSSSVLELGTHKIAHPDVHYIEDIEVQMWRLDEYFGVHGLGKNYDFLNIDVQGFELNVLRGIGDLLKQFNYVYLEVNQQELYKECALIDSIDLFMTANGLRRVETKWCGNTGWGDALYIR